MSKRIGWTLAACAVLLLAWGLFLVGIDDASMWFDDDYSWRISRDWTHQCDSIYHPGRSSPGVLFAAVGLDVVDRE
jgi:hypothetical protein